MSYYAVAKGRTTGVFTLWNEAKAQVVEFKGARFKKFNTRLEADEFVKTSQSKIEDFFTPLKPTKGDGSLVETEDTLVVFTDGACLANGKQGAIGSFAVVWPFHPSYNHAERLGEGQHTNNRGETCAVIHAIEQALRIDENENKKLMVYTDSQFVINSATKWMQKWKKNNWKKADGNEIANLDLVKKLDKLMTGKRIIVFEHVEAHTQKKDWKSMYNNTVDKLAKTVL